jgi:hypothetical protein
LIDGEKRAQSMVSDPLLSFFTLAPVRVSNGQKSGRCSNHDFASLPLIYGDSGQPSVGQEVKH